MENQNLRDVVQLIQDTARQADRDRIEMLEFKDAKGGTHTLPVAFVPDGAGKTRIQPLTTELETARSYAESNRLKNQAGPDRRTGTANHQSLASFIAHVNAFKDDHSAVWAEADGQHARLVAIFDYNQEGPDGKPRWGSHRAVYPCPRSDAWTAWGAGAELQMGQDELAEFLEAHDYELATGSLKTGATAPTPSFLVSMANKLEVYSSAKALRERDPNTGRVRISYQEDKGIAGDVMPPPAFLILIPVFEDSEPELIEVRLRVKVADGQAVFRLCIHEADRIWRKSFAKVRADVIVETALPVFEGTAE